MQRIITSKSDENKWLLCTHPEMCHICHSCQSPEGIMGGRMELSQRSKMGGNLLTMAGLLSIEVREEVAVCTRLHKTGTINTQLWIENRFIGRFISYKLNSLIPQCYRLWQTVYSCANKQPLFIFKQTTLI